TTSDVWLADAGHGDGRLNTGRMAELLQRALEGQSIYHRGQHAHVIAGGTIHPPSGGGDAAEDVAAADHQANFHTHRVDLRDIPRDPRHRLHLDAELLRP